MAERLDVRIMHKEADLIIIQQVYLGETGKIISIIAEDACLFYWLILLWKGSLFVSDDRHQCYKINYCSDSQPFLCPHPLQNIDVLALPLNVWLV